MNDGRYRYSIPQFIQLRQTIVALTVISLVASVLTVFVYVYMLIFHRAKANRVSLRCVFFACVTDIVYSIFTIVRTVQSGYTPFCKTAAVIVHFLNLLRSSLLALVGINLVLIFVYGVKRTDLLERFYYPFAILYSIIGTCVPIYEQISSNRNMSSRHRCWNIEYYEHRTIDTFSWMWFYAFVFFINLVAVICSALALIKLIREQRSFVSRMESINNSPHNSTTSGRLEEDAIRKQHHAVLKKVVLRCIIYPLVPFLVNIFGFILQVILTSTHHRPPFALAMLSSIFMTLAGLLVSIVFFTDPAITNFFSQTYKKYHQKYVDDYVIVLKPKSKLLPISRSPTSSTRSSILPLNKQPSSVPPASPAFSQLSYEIRPISCISVTCDEKSVDDSKPHFKENYTKTIMCRIQDTQSKQRLQSSPVAVPQKAVVRNQQEDVDTPDDMFIPYHHPRVARFLHFILTGFGLKQKSKNLEDTSIYEMNIVSIPRSSDEEGSNLTPETYTRHY